MIFYGQWNPRVDEVLFRNYFENKKEGLCVECGAADGISDSCCKFFEMQGWKAVNIEANLTNYSKLIQYRPTSININAVLSEYDGKAIFQNDSVVRIADKGESPPNAIDTISYKRLLEKINNQQIDLFCLDVEGHEPYVLKGMVNSGLPMPKVFCIEYPFCTTDVIISTLKHIYRIDGISFNNIFLSTPDMKVKTPFWGRTQKAELVNGYWKFAEKAEY